MGVICEFCFEKINDDSPPHSCGGTRTAFSYIQLAKALEEERKKFHRETMRTSQLYQVIEQFIEFHCPNHWPGPWSKGCRLCEITKAAHDILKEPINA